MPPHDSLRATRRRVHELEVELAAVQVREVARVMDVLARVQALEAALALHIADARVHTAVRVER